VATFEENLGFNPRRRSRGAAELTTTVGDEGRAGVEDDAAGGSGDEDEDERGAMEDEQ
jgi:hypothetical protein